MLHFIETLGPRSAAAQEGGHSRQRFSALPTAGQDITPHPPQPHLQLFLCSPALGGMLQRAAGTPGAQHLPASLLLPTQCYSLYVSPNKLDKTSLRRLLEKP